MGGALGEQRQRVVALKQRAAAREGIFVSARPVALRAARQALVARSIHRQRIERLHQQPADRVGKKGALRQKRNMPAHPDHQHQRVLMRHHRTQVFARTHHHPRDAHLAGAAQRFAQQHIALLGLLAGHQQIRFLVIARVDLRRIHE